MILEGQLPDLCWQHLEIRRLGRSLRPTNHVCGSRQQLLLPFGDLGGVDAELLSLFGQRLVPFDRCQCHLSLKGCSVIPSRSLYCLAPLVHHLSVAFGKLGYHFAYCPISRPPLTLALSLKCHSL